MPWYRVVKTINGRRYFYDQQTYRVGRSVKTRNRYIGRAGDAGRPTSSPRRTVVPAPFDAAAEAALVAALFDPSTATQWHVPWTRPYRAAGPAWSPDPRVLSLPQRMRVPAVSLPHLRHQGRTYGPAGAAYSATRNRLIIPDPSKFRGIDADTTAQQQFEAALLHECAHATATKPECDRPLSPFYGDATYAREELVAETTAQIVMHRLGLATAVSGSAAHYLQSWLDRCYDQAAARAYAEREARKAADYLCALIARPADPRVL